MGHMTTKLLLSTSLLLALAATAVAQRPDGRMSPPPGVIRTTGQASLQAEPDRAVVRLGVETRGQTAEQAATENSRQTQAVIDKLKADIGSSGTVQTSNFSIREDRRFNQSTQTDEPNGFIATNIVVARFNQIDRTGEILDAAIKAGVNQVQSVSFDLEDDTAVRNKALKQAAADAKAKAEVLASSVGLKLGRVVSIEDSEAPIIRPFEARAQANMAMSAAKVPIETGSVEVSATVQMTHEIEQ